LSLIDKSFVVRKIVNDLAEQAIGFKADIITTPPASSNKVGFAEYVARKISTVSGIKYLTVFKPHNTGKRFGMKAKIKPLNIDFSQAITGKRVFLFDDFSMTQHTMAQAIGSLKDNRNIVMGFVLYAN
jgi:orotate phosphoribosyltransferase-like protein